MAPQGVLLANPILEALCQSFYEEEKWQRALMVNINGDDEWISSLTITMVSLAATSVRTLLQILKVILIWVQYYSALEEWKSGNFVQRPFDAGRYAGPCMDIFNYITTLIDNDPQGYLITDRLKSWAIERCAVQLHSCSTRQLKAPVSAFVQELETGNDE